MFKVGAPVDISAWDPVMGAKGAVWAIAAMPAVLRCIYRTPGGPSSTGRGVT